MPALSATLTANAAPMEREFKSAVRMSQRAGEDIRAGLQGGSLHSGKSGVINETLVLFREMSRGNWSRVPGSLTLLIQRMGLLSQITGDANSALKAAASATREVVRENLSAAAATMMLAEAELKEASAELLSEYADKSKAESAMQSSAAKYLNAEASLAEASAANKASLAQSESAAAAGFAITPLGWLAIALIAVGTAAYFTIRHFVTLAKEEKNLAELMDLTTVKFSDQADEIRRAADAAADLAFWLKELEKDESYFGDAVEETLDNMRERARLERELATDKGASKREIAQMEIEESRKELAFLTAAEAQAEKNLAADKANLIADENAAHDPKRGLLIDSAKKHAKTAGELVDAIQEKMQEGVTETGGSFSGILGGQGLMGGHREATENDKMDVTVGRKQYHLSLKEAQAMSDSITKEEARLETVQRELDDKAKSSKSLTAKDKQQVVKLTKERDKLANHLKLQEEFLPQIADAGKGRMVHGHVSNLQAVGAYTPAAVHVDIAKQTLKHVASIDKHVTKGGKGHVGGGGRPDFGDH